MGARARARACGRARGWAEAGGGGDGGPAAEGEERELSEAGGRAEDGAVPGLPLQPPGDTPCTLRLGAFAAAAAAALAAAARAAFPALPGRASPSGWAKRRGSGGGSGGTSVSLPLEISFCFPRRLTLPPPFFEEG